MRLCECQSAVAFLYTSDSVPVAVKLAFGGVKTFNPVLGKDWRTTRKGYSYLFDYPLFSLVVSCPHRGATFGCGLRLGCRTDNRGCVRGSL